MLLEQENLGSILIAAMKFQVGMLHFRKAHRWAWICYTIIQHIAHKTSNDKSRKQGNTQGEAKGRISYNGLDLSSVCLACLSAPEENSQTCPAKSFKSSG